jgi:AraC family transcriptional regulator
MSWAFVVDGDFGSTTSVGLRWYSANELGLLRAGMTHANRYGTTGARCMIVEHRRMDDATMRMARGLGDSGHFPSHSAPAAIAGRVYREFAEQDTAADLVIDGLLATMTAYAVRANTGSRRADIRRPYHESTSGPWLERVRELLHSEFRSRLRLETLAEFAGVHEVHLARSFKRKYGCSPMYYIRRLRFAWARNELTTSDRPIAEIAIEAGFTDQSHFGRHFRRLTGMSPAAYRSSGRKRG